MAACVAPVDLNPCSGSELFARDGQMPQFLWPRKRRWARRELPEEQRSPHRHTLLESARRLKYPERFAMLG